MALSTIKTALAAKIAAVTSATPSDELGILKTLAKKLGLTTTALVNAANTASDSATVSSDLIDLALWSQAINEYTGNSIIGESRAFAPGMPIDFVDSDGARWLRTGFIESDATKYDLTKWEYPLAGSVNKAENTPQNTSHKVSTRAFKLPNGKYVSINYGNRNTIQTFDNPFDTTYTTVYTVPETVIGCDYHAGKDILLVLSDSGVLYVGKTNCTSWSTISTATSGTNSQNASVHWIVDDIFICGFGLLRRSVNEGTSWTSHSSPNGTTYYVGLAYNPTLNLLYMMGRAGSSKYSAFTSASAYTLYTCILGDTTWTTRTTGGGGFCIAEGHIENFPIWTFHHNDTASNQTVWVIGINLINGNTYQFTVNSATTSQSLCAQLITINNKKYVVIVSPSGTYVSLTEYVPDTVNKIWFIKSVFSKTVSLGHSGNNGQEGMLANGIVIGATLFFPASITGQTNYSFVGGAGNSTASAGNGQLVYVRIS